MRLAVRRWYASFVRRFILAYFQCHYGVKVNVRQCHNGVLLRYLSGRITDWIDRRCATDMRMKMQGTACVLDNPEIIMI